MLLVSDVIIVQSPHMIALYVLYNLSANPLAIASQASRMVNNHVFHGSSLIVDVSGR